MIRELRKADINKVANIWLDTNITAHYFIPGNLYFPAYDFLQPVWKRIAGCL